MKHYLWLCLILFPAGSRGQDYIDYQRIINRVDNQIVAGDFRAAARRMDSIDRQYDFVFARHCIKGLQLACLSEDESRAAHWMTRCFVQGVPLWMIRNNALTKRTLSWPATGVVVGKYDSLHSVYLSRIDTALSRRIDRLMDRDAFYTRRVNDGAFPLRQTLYALQWVRNNTREIREIEEIIAQYGYPEEKIIGLPAKTGDSAGLARYMRHAGIDLVAQNRQAFFMYLHYFSTKRAGTRTMSLLRPQIAIGNMPAYQYARLQDYLSDVTSAKKYPVYLEFSALKPWMDTTGLDSRRAAIGLSSYAEGDRNRAIRLKREFSGAADEEVVLE